MPFLRVDEEARLILNDSGRDASPGQRQSAGASSADKGRLVEGIVAAMHELSGVNVERNVLLPGAGPRKREIDVLVSGRLAGHPVRIAIECKNEKGRIGVPKVDAFLGRLADVGIPSQHGIIVSSSGYTSGAIARAQSAGMRALVLTGLDKDRLASAVAEAFQSIVYLLLDVAQITITNNVPSSQHPQDMLVFYDREQQLCGSLPDLVWQKWREGALPMSIGESEIKMAIPDEWRTIVDGKAEPVLGAWLKVRVLGLVITLRGSSEQHALVDAVDGTVERLQVRAAFDGPGGTYPVRCAQTEAELTEILSEPRAVALSVGRIRLPRIRLGPMYWPPSERIAQELSLRMGAFVAGKGSDPRPLDFAELEGTDLRTIWEPVSGTYLAGGSGQVD